MQMYCPASKKHVSPFPVVYSPVTCTWCLTLGKASRKFPSRISAISPLSVSRDRRSHGCGAIISIDLGSVLEDDLSKRYFFTLTCNSNRYSMKEWISFFLVWCMEDPQMSLYGWNAWHGQTEQHNRLVFVIVVNGWLEVSVHDDRWWYFESLVGRFVNRRHV